MKKLLSVLLVMLLILSAWAFAEEEITEPFPEDEIEDELYEEVDEETAEPFSFRNGITWGMTREQVLEAEGNPKYETDRDDVIDIIEIEDVQFGGAECDLEYHFANDALFMAVVEYDDDAKVDFADLRARLTERFGEPGAFSEAIKAELSEDELKELDTIASWTLPDGTEVWLMEDSDDHTIDIAFVDLGW